MKQCALCRSYDIRYDEAVGAYRCQSCWGLIVKEPAEQALLAVTQAGAMKPHDAVRLAVERHGVAESPARIALWTLLDRGRLLLTPDWMVTHG